MTAHQAERNRQGGQPCRPLDERKTDTGFAILEEIRLRESIPADERKRVKV